MILLQESYCDAFVHESYDKPETVPQPYIDSAGLANLLKALPPKVVCDALLQAFVIGVRPVLPLVHMPTFQTDYNNFWQWARNSDIALPDPKLFSDPTFLCLLFSILYCGAKTATASMWATSALHGMKKETIIDKMMLASSTSLRLCKHSQYPTISTLVALLLAHGCSGQGGEPVEDLGFISTAVRIAQIMGLHRDGALFGFDTRTCEMRRRVWWYIVSIDVSTSRLHGTQTCCGPIYGSRRDVRMVSKIRDEDLSERGADLLSPLPTPPSGTISVAMLLLIGRFEAAKFEHYLINYLHNAHALGQPQFNELTCAARKVMVQIESLISIIPVQGFPEKGFIPARLANASPTTHEGLYGDHTSQPTVLSSWARIMLTMIKSEIAILVHHPFLGRADSIDKQQQKRWNRYVDLHLG
ncbi:hypothetical protein DV737_g4171, partial [Chaetothyriales sp. CBS 132003]